MKAYLSILALALITLAGCNSDTNKTPEIPDAAHNSQNSLDWNGSYTGILPCASCPGIRTEIKLSTDNTYKLTSIYMDDENENIFREEGEFEWSKDGANITLVDSEPKITFKVGENILFLLDENGERIEGELADHYKLSKVMADDEIIGKYWRLIEVDGKKVEESSIQSREAHFVLNEDDKVAGNLGCNTFNGSYKLEDDNKISFSKMAVTMMACEDMSVESAFSKALEQTNHFTTGGGVLILSNKEDNKSNTLAKFEAVYL